MIISKTPVRISLVGGGTDFESFYREHGGCVVSMAIDKYVYVIIKERFDDLIVLNYTQHEVVDDISKIKHDLIRECLRFMGVEKGVEITTLADIPSKGSGLGSSSAITIGLLNALMGYIGNSSSHQELADMACHIEIDILKSPIGRQDQYACAFGGLNSIVFDKRGVAVAPFPKDRYAITDNLFLHYIGETRHANTILQKQQDNIGKHTDALLKLKSLAEDVWSALGEEDYVKIGLAIGEGWDIKKSLADSISNPEVDYIIDMAYNNYALGAKLLGAGGTGFVLSYVPPDRRALFCKGMEDYRKLPFKIDPFGTRIIFNIQ